MPLALLTQSDPRYESRGQGVAARNSVFFHTLSELKTSPSLASVNADYIENCTALHFGLSS